MHAPARMAIALDALLIGLLVAALALLWLYGAVRGSLPRLDGSIEVSGLRDTVALRRDASGVASIEANSIADAYFTLGYVHAQDRLWQMDLQRRLAGGTLSEIMGKATVGADKYTRTLGLAEAARHSLSCVDSSTRADIEAYVRGINQFITGASRHSPEFTLLRIRPATWSAEDVLSIGKLLAWMVCSSHVLELLRADLLESFTEEQVNRLLPDFRTVHSAVQTLFPRKWTEPPQAVQPLAPQPQIRAGQGSNLWIVGPERSQSGHAVLANDPHLALSIPGPLYAVAVRAGDAHFAGATLPGIPAVISGRNDHIAWGVTNLGPDVQDLYVEQLTPDGAHYVEGSCVLPLEIDVQEIAVKGSESVRFEIQRTGRGPLISGVLHGDTEAYRNTRGARPPLSLQWTGASPADTSVQALMRLNFAKSWNEFRDALKGHGAPALNFGFADARGNIGLQTAGWIPRRRVGDGSVPGDASSGYCGWAGFVAFEELPSTLNPPSGFLVSTNNVAPSQAGHVDLGRDWIRPSRKRRIESLISSTKRLSLQDHRAIQQDSVSGDALELLQLAKVFFRSNDHAVTEAGTLLFGWNGEMAPDSAAAAVFAAWHLHAITALLESVVGAQLALAYRHWTSYTNQLLLDVLRGTVRTPLEPQRLVSEALERATQDLRRRLGKNVSSWRWDRLNTAVFAHTPFHYFPLLRSIFTRKTGIAGYIDTINISGLTPAQPYTSRLAAAYRQIIDMGSDEPLYCLPPGQSGHVLSRHYDDQLTDWKHCRYRQLPFAVRRPETSWMHRLTLRPARRSEC